MTAPIRATPSAKRPVDRDMTAIRSRPRVRRRLAAKFTVPVTIVLSVVMVIFGLVVWNHMSVALDDALDRTGTLAAELAASPEIDSWGADYNTVANLHTRIARIETELELAGDPSAPDRTRPGGSPEQKKILERLASFDAGQRAFNRHRLERLRENHGALDVIIEARDRQTGLYGLVASASGSAAGKMEVVRRSESGETTIESGYWKSDKKDREPARSFRHPILNQQKERVGTAMVIFSESFLDEQLQSLRNRIIGFCVLGFIASA